MREVLATKLSDRPVLADDGETIGTVHNVTMNLRTGDLETLTVDPDADVDAVETDSEGRIRLPAECIESVDDYLVVDRTRAPAGSGDEATADGGDGGE
ncbi:PRC-barrel domain-containing protein [Halomicrobium salinisoli]|uniref:PRC-barrel domain-containing protein n=1 Tax=Halomicrobium salinisoli TaxID=2878391 RepID=UPI001CF00FB2|nr:PRC-barrel domain-containing protein [Halomicrobium salinisoli]